MTTHVEFIEEEQMGDLLDILYYCSAACYESDNPTKSAYGHAWPGGMETNSDVYCEHCGTILWRGLESGAV